MRISKGGGILVKGKSIKEQRNTALSHGMGMGFGIGLILMAGVLFAFRQALETIRPEALVITERGVQLVVVYPELIDLLFPAACVIGPLLIVLFAFAERDARAKGM